MKKIFTLLVVLAVQSLLVEAFAQGSVMVVKVGDGSAALSNASTSTYLLEYKTDGTLLNTYAMPTAVSGANRILTLSGTATSEGLITRSDDKRYILITGYDAAPGTATVNTTTSAAVNRVVGRLDASGNLDVTTALNDYASAGNPRSVVSTDGSAFWLSGSNVGVRYATFGATTSVQVESSVANTRYLNIFGGQLYTTSGSSGIRIATVGTGLPTSTGQTVTNLNGIPTATGSPYGFFFADLSPSVAGYDVLYIANDDATGLQKYSFDGTAWVSNGFISGSVRGLTGSVTGTTVTLFATTNTASANSLITITDASGYNATITGTPVTIATAPANTAFRGVALAPETVVTGINTPNKAKEISIYPNPARAFFTISLPDEISNYQSQISVYDVMGRVQFTDKIVNSNLYTVNQMLSPGVYFVKVIAGRNVYQQKLVVQ